MHKIKAVVVGASQAGLAMSHELKRVGVEHVVLERNKIGHGWHERWDSFCLVTPNWSVQLPGYQYNGDDPDGFMPRDEIVAYLEGYARSFDAPVLEGVAVHAASRNGDGFLIETSADQYRADSLILATGAFQRPHRPPGSDALPNRLFLIDLDGYTHPEALPAGDVLIVGSGQSGCQIAEELHEAGRRVVLSCGRAPWFLRRIGDRDFVWWAIESGFFDVKADDLPKDARLFANVLATGHGGGRDLHLRTLQALGVILVGRFLGADEKKARFANDLAENVQWGDEKYGQIKKLILNLVEQQGLDTLDIADPEPFVADAPDRVDLSTFGTVIFTGGFRPDFRSWLPWPDAFDDQGFPHQRDGTSTVVDGLHFVGLHFLRKRKSALLYGVGEDAGIVADTIAAQ
ncbi:MAG: NAD(P)-binding domain-containing protein [Xanthobacteraceae bacterium]